MRKPDFRIYAKTKAQISCEINTNTVTPLYFDFVFLFHVLGRWMKYFQYKKNKKIVSHRLNLPPVSMHE